MKKSRIIIIFVCLILALIGAYWFTLGRNQPTQSTEVDKGNFNIQADLPEGWSRRLKISQNQEKSQTDIVEFSTKNITVEVKTTILEPPSNQIFTGYDPTMRERKPFQWEYKTKYFPVKRDGVRLIRIMEMVNPSEYYIVDGNSFATSSEGDTFIYELPILVTRSGKTTKTIIKYYTTSSLSEDELNKALEEADKVTLSLKSE